MSTKKLISFLVLLMVLAGCREKKTDIPVEKAIINGLLPATQISDDTLRFDLKTRMVKWDVPAVSIVVIDNMEIVYTGAFGIKKKTNSSSVPTESGSKSNEHAPTIDPNTLFQAASVSKPVTATGFMALAREKNIDINADISELCPDWSFPRGDIEGKISPHRILSHTAGLNVGGFTGYNPGDNLPTLNQMIDGTPPANSPAVKLIEKPGKKFRYSGGGYQVLQKIMEELDDKPFHQIMSEQVFNPLTMKHSYYAPLDSHTNENAAFGHLETGFIPGHAPIHVESAAGGLWTTPSDLGRWLIELMKAYNGQQSSFLDRSTVQTIMKPGLWDFGLGFKVMGAGKNLRFSHGGGTTGWHCHFMAYPEREEAVVIMTNGTNGWVLWPEIERSVAYWLDWPVPKPLSIERIDFAPEQLSEYHGVYDMHGLKLSIRPVSSSLVLEGAGLRWTLIPVATDTLQIMEMEGQAIFRRDQNERVNKLHLWFDQPDWSPYRAWDFTRSMDD